MAPVRTPRLSAPAAIAAIRYCACLRILRGHPDRCRRPGNPCKAGRVYISRRRLPDRQCVHLTIAANLSSISFTSGKARRTAAKTIAVIGEGADPVDAEVTKFPVQLLDDMPVEAEYSDAHGLWDA